MRSGVHRRWRSGRAPWVWTSLPASDRQRPGAIVCPPRSRRIAPDRPVRIDRSRPRDQSGIPPGRCRCRRPSAMRPPRSARRPLDKEARFAVAGRRDDRDDRSIRGRPDLAQQPGPAQRPYVPVRHDKPCFKERIGQTGRAFAVCEVLKLDRCDLDGRDGSRHAVYRLKARFGTAPLVKAGMVEEEPADGSISRRVIGDSAAPRAHAIGTIRPPTGRMRCAERRPSVTASRWAAVMSTLRCKRGRRAHVRSRPGPRVPLRAVC